MWGGMKTWLATLMALVALAGCKAKPDGTYTVEGTVQGVSGRVVRVHHDAIPNYVNRNREKSPMASMVMGFEMHDNVFHASSLQEGDRIEFTFEVRFNAEPALLMTEVKLIEASPATGEGEAAAPPADG